MMRYALILAVAIATGCSQQAPETTVVIGEPTSAVAFNVAGAPTVEFNVPDMMCPEGCGAKTKEILSELPGAKEVAINFDSKTATVAIEEGKFDTDAAIAALKDYGFENSTLKTMETSDEPAAEPATLPAG